MFLPRFHSCLAGGFPWFTSWGIPLGILALHLFSFTDVVLRNLYDFLSVMDFCFHSAKSLSLLLKFFNLSHSETFSLRKRGVAFPFLGVSSSSPSSEPCFLVPLGMFLF